MYRLFLGCAFLTLNTVLMAADIVTSWNHSGAGIDGFTITHIVNGEVNPVVNVGSDDRTYTFNDAVKGVHIFTIEGYVGDLKSGKSEPVTLLYLDKLIMTIEITM